ncbi:MAG: SDR family oxidoreductase [Candidatus Aenigmarchaeota archaeon]|nr:SDR family oxidoreductase [Candidatus Aenigmarchaeota archaeon]
MMLKNKVVIVTGASKGIGKAIALAFSKEGAMLAVCSRNLAELNGKGLKNSDVLQIQADISKAEDCRKVVSQAIERFGRIDILVNNAGMYIGGKTESTEEENIESLIDTNAKGTIFMTRACLPYMIRQNSGHIINISSVSGLTGMKNEAAYSASKFAVTGFSLALQKDVREHGIKVSYICPGATHTFDAKYPERLLKPEDVAEAVLFAASRPGNVLVNSLTITPLESDFGKVI